MTADVYDVDPEVAALFDDEQWDALPEPPPFAERLFTVEHLDRGVLCEQLIRSCRNLEARKAALEAEMDRLRMKLRAVDNRREEARDFLQSQMVLMGRKTVRTPIGTASIVAGRDKIVLDEPNIQQHIMRWPASLVDKVVEFPPPNVNKQVLQREFGPALLKELPGVSLECGDDYLMIR